MEETNVVQSKDGTISVASTFTGHQEAVQDRDLKFFPNVIEEAYNGVNSGHGGPLVLLWFIMMRLSRFVATWF